MSSFILEAERKNGYNSNEYVTMHPSWIAFIHLYIKVGIKYKFNILTHTAQLVGASPHHRGAVGSISGRACTWVVGPSSSQVHTPSPVPALMGGNWSVFLSSPACLPSSLNVLSEDKNKVPSTHENHTGQSYP